MSSAETAETARLRADIERTRAEMGGTIDAIQERLNPQHIAEQVRHTVQEQFEEAKATVRDATIGKAETLMRDAGETMNEARYTFSDTVRHNPIPAAMVAIGLGWLFMNRSSRPRYPERYDERRPMAYQTNHPAYRGEAVVMYPDTQRYDQGALARGQRAVGGAVNQAQDAVGDAASRAQRAVGGAVNQAQDAVGDAASRAQRTVGGAVNQAQDAASRAQDAVGGAVNQAQDVVGGAVNQAQRAVGDAASRVQDTAGHLAGRTVYQAERLEDRFQQTLRESPLVVGAIALALGTAAGFALPQTERENQLMGEARDNLVEQAQTTAQETLEKVQQVAGDVAKDAEQKATEKAREVGLTGEKR